MRTMPSGHQVPTVKGIIAQLDLDFRGIDTLNRLNNVRVSFEPASAVETNKLAPFSIARGHKARIYFKRVRSGEVYPALKVRLSAGNGDIKRDFDLPEVPVPVIVKRDRADVTYSGSSGQIVEFPLHREGDNNWSAGDPSGTLTVKSVLKRENGRYQIGVQIDGEIVEPNGDSRLKGNSHFKAVGEWFDIPDGFAVQKTSVDDQASGGWSRNDPPAFENDRNAGQPSLPYAGFVSPTDHGLVKNWKVYINGNKAVITLRNVILSAVVTTYTPELLVELPGTLPKDDIPR